MGIAFGSTHPTTLVFVAFQSMSEAFGEQGKARGVGDDVELAR